MKNAHYSMLKIRQIKIATIRTLKLLLCGHRSARPEVVNRIKGAQAKDVLWLRRCKPTWFYNWKTTPKNKAINISMLLINE